MSQGDNSPGIARLTGLIKAVVDRTKEATEDPSILDFGVILDDMSLITNQFPTPIPPGDYLVCRNSALPDEEVTETEGHRHDVTEGEFDLELSSGGDPSHTHSKSGGKVAAHKTQLQTDKVNIARKTQRHILPGDRVLVAWVQNDPVVIDIIIQANEIPFLDE